MVRVLGVDTSTQATKALLVDAGDGSVLASGRAMHPSGTEVDPRAWLTAFDRATEDLLPSASAVSVAGQQHGMVALDSNDEPVRPALLWHDTRSAEAAEQLIEELGGPEACVRSVGSVLVASFTVTKLRWLRDHEPESAARVKSVLLPHDYVSWHVTERRASAFTDRGDASGTGYFDPVKNVWLDDLAAAALGRPVQLPEVIEPSAPAYSGPRVVAAGTGDNMAAALGLGLRPGDVAISIGTSGVASSVSLHPPSDASGTVTGFANASGGFLPMVTTLNGAPVLEQHARLLGVDLPRLAELALAAPPGSNGLSVLPYYRGERTPNRPDATGVWSGLTYATTRQDLARAAVEALLCSLRDAMEALVQRTETPVERLILLGGAAQNAAVQALAPAVLESPVLVPEWVEFAARGAARQAAWALSGQPEPPQWPDVPMQLLEADPQPEIYDRYMQLKNRTASWQAAPRQEGHHEHHIQR